MDREQFRVDRVAKMDTIAENLLPEARDAIETGDNEALLAAVAEEFTAVFANQPGFAVADTPAEAWNWFKKRIMPGIDAIKPTSVAETVAGWLGTAIVNGARVAAAEGANKTWISRKDGKVRPFHVEADGQTVLWSDPFTVCGEVEMMFPGDPVGDPSCWINCRCVAGPASMVSSAEEGEPMTDLPIEDVPVDDTEDDGFMDDEFLDDEDEDQELIGSGLQWHGVLAPEGVMSGDGRMFSEGALSWRDLPLPLRWQEADTGAHDGAVTIATIDRIERRGNLLMGEGQFSDIDLADKAVGMIGEGALKGVSIDADSAELAESSEDGSVEFSKGRISAATLVAIPAFAEAYIALGPLPDGEEDMVTSDTTLPPGEEVAEEVLLTSDEGEEFRNYDAAQRRKMAEKGWALPDGSFPITDEADLRNAIQAIGRASDPAQAKAHIKKRARALGHPELIPEDWATDTDEFALETLARGPGWVTNPKETRRLHAYWTKPGHKGYAKVRWGTPGDFTRLRRFLSKYIPANLLNRVAAQWHFDALGFWPGELGRPGNPPATRENRRRAARHASNDEVVNLSHASEHSKDALPQGTQIHPGEHVSDTQHGQQDLQNLQKGTVRSQQDDTSRPALVEGGQTGTGRVLAVDRGQDNPPARMAGGSSVRRDIPGRKRRGKKFAGTPRGVGSSQRIDTRGNDDRSSVQSEVVLQPSASGSSDGSGEYEETMAASAINLVAATTQPVDSTFFDDPQLDGPTALIVEDDHVYGHIAAWSTCHVGIKDVCTTPPHSNRDYAYFRTGAVLTDKGRISVGQLTLGTGHAGLSAGARQAAAHYDNTGTVVADVAAGEDEHGIWVAGKVRDTATPEQVHALQAGAISGDWRAIGGELELIAALVVNVPGFPVQRPALAADAGEQISLVAAGIVDGYADVPDVNSITTLVIEEMARREQLATKITASKHIINQERVAALQASVLR